MPYVRDRMRDAAACKDRARERGNLYREVSAGGPASRRVDFGTALDWFRAAAVYVVRRNYRDKPAQGAALARRAEIFAAAAAVIQEHADRIDREVPQWFRPKTRRAEFRAAASNARTTEERLNAARAWFMFSARQAERFGGETAGRAAAIETEVAMRLIEWAREMDADDYGQ